VKKGYQSVSNVAPEAVRIGDWVFYASVFRLEHDQEVVKLEPRVAHLLSCLMTNAGKPVSRETLMEEVWPDMIVGDEALTNAINKLRKAFNDNRQNPRVIETIPKAGYRLIADVNQISSPIPHANDESTSHDIDANKPHWFSRKLSIFTTIALTIIIVTLWLPIEPDSNNTPPPIKSSTFATKPSIAVLPFDNISQIPEQEYFTDGITDDIITHLAKNPDIVVIARDSSFFYKNSDMDIRSIANSLHVSHILNGSIRRLGEKLIINAQLIDAAKETHTWAEQYLLTADELLKVESEITQSIISSLLNKKQNNSSLPPLSIPTKHIQAHDYLLLGRYHFYKFANKSENTKAQNLFREAINLDPNYALAYALLGWTYDFETMNGWTDDRIATLKKAEQLATKAIELQPELPLSYFVRGLSYREQGEYVKALGEIEISLKHDPNNANARVLLATLLYYAGRPTLGLERIKEAMKIHPHHPYNYHFHLGQAYFVLRQYEDAIDAFQLGIDSNPAAERLHVWMAATYAQNGDIDDASWEAELVMSSNPNFSVTRIEEAFPFKDHADLKHFTDGLRLAGLK
jgi:TolB-like protein/DNA-binding winged helix-turn-helix (wHTH) protein/Tfp pilus assembly protein PilF